MGPVSASVEVDVSRERAFDFLADLANRPAFTGHFISGFHLTRLESTGIGAAARFRFDVAPQAVWFDSAIEGLSRPHRISERGQGGRANRIPCAIEWELSEGPGALSTIRVVHWTSPANQVDRAREVVGAASYWYGRNWRMALRRLRDLLESDGAPPPPVGVGGGNRFPTGIR